MIGQLNQVVTFCVFTNDLSANRTPIVEHDSCYTDYVKIERLNSSRTLEQSSIAFTVAFRITKRYYQDRQINPALTQIEYGNLLLSIHSVTPIIEGRRTYEEIIAYASNNTG